MSTEKKLYPSLLTNNTTLNQSRKDPEKIIRNKSMDFIDALLKQLNFLNIEVMFLTLKGEK